MLRAGLAADRQVLAALAPMRRQAQAVATAEVLAASSAAVAADTTLAEKLRQIDDRLAALE